MRHIVALFLIVLGLGGFLVGQGLSHVSAQTPHASRVIIDGAIDPTSADFLARAIDTASENGSRLIIVQLDTPGGLLSSTRDMVGSITSSEIPVVVYVAPEGAQAASAGTFITAASHVAAMAPTTNIGAASPVASGGQELPETLKSKATQDAAAFMRGLAEARDRNAEALEQTVLEARSYSASEAVEQNVVDLMADDIDGLLAQIDGRSVTLDDGSVSLDTDGLAVQSIERTPVERFIAFLSNPNIAFLLLSLGGLGILLELLNPGITIPGVAGVIFLALGFVAMGNLPVNWVGLGLMALAMVLFFVEMQAPGLGVAGIGGAISFILGAFLLFGSFGTPAIPTPSFRVSLWLIGIVSAVIFGILILFFRAALQARRAPTSGGDSRRRLISQVGRVTTTLEPKGTVHVAGELWTAESDSGETIPKDEEVIVLDVEGLTLKVFRAEGGSPDGLESSDLKEHQG